MIFQENELKKQRREENAKRREENELRSQTVQVRQIVKTKTFEPLLTRKFSLSDHQKHSKTQAHQEEATSTNSEARSRSVEGKSCVEIARNLIIKFLFLFSSINIFQCQMLQRRENIINSLTITYLITLQTKKDDKIVETFSKEKFGMNLEVLGKEQLRIF
jgi:hypothetical protein